MKNNSVVIDTTHGLIHFIHLTMQVKTASEMSSEAQIVFCDNVLTILPKTTKTITAFVDQPWEWITTGTVTPLEKFTETASLLFSHSTSTIIDRQVALRVTNTTETPYLIKRYTKIAEFSVVTPEQSKYIRPVDTLILSMIPECDPDLTAYLNELLRTNKPEQKSNTFWFPTPENTRENWKPHSNTNTKPQGTHEMEDKKKINPKRRHEINSLNDLDETVHCWQKTRKRKTGNKDFLFHYHEIFARQSGYWMNTDIKVKLTRKDNKVVHSRNLPLPIHLKKDLLVEIALMHKYGIITVLLFSKYVSPIFAEKTQRKTMSSCGSQKNEHSNCEWLN